MAGITGKASDLTIVEARSQDDMDAVRSLCEGFLGWLRERYAHEAWLIDRYYAPDQWQSVLESLPMVHAPPQGSILLARLNGQPVGCAMMRRLDEATCEMKRLFVHPKARGYGVGRALCERLMRLSAERGYKTMRLDTGVHHEEAIPLYRALGFEMRDALIPARPKLPNCCTSWKRSCLSDKNGWRQE